MYVWSLGNNHRNRLVNIKGEKARVFVRGDVSQKIPLLFPRPQPRVCFADESEKADRVGAGMEQMEARRQAPSSRWLVAVVASVEAL